MKEICASKPFCQSELSHLLRRNWKKVRMKALLFWRVTLWRAETQFLTVFKFTLLLTSTLAMPLWMSILRPVQALKLEMFLPSTSLLKLSISRHSSLTVQMTRKTTWRWTCCLWLMKTLHVKLSLTSNLNQATPKSFKTAQIMLPGKFTFL